MKKYKHLFIVFIAIFILLSLLSPSRFLSLNNLQTMLAQVPEFGIITLGMMIVILTGGINLSITSASAFSGIMAASFLVKYGHSDFNIFLIILATVIIAILAAIFTGVLNGTIIAYIGVTPIIVTLGTKILLEGICIRFTKGGGISNYPEEFFYLGSGTIFGIPVPFVIFALIVIFLYILLEKTSWGTKVYFIGSNETAANFSGINVRKIKMQVYIISSILSAAAAIIMMSRYNSVKANLGSSYLLQSIAASVLGGTNIAGGKGSVFGTVIAIGIIQIISSGLNILNVNRFITDSIMGLILIVVLLINSFQNNHQLSSLFSFRKKVGS
ncbi:MAG: ABC transporter permease [Firmicutes bacterium]|nr:ABC transporter permease [Bacillota bacterium]